MPTLCQTVPPPKSPSVRVLGARNKAKFRLVDFELLGVDQRQVRVGLIPVTTHTASSDRNHKINLLILKTKSVDGKRRLGRQKQEQHLSFYRIERDIRPFDAFYARFIRDLPAGLSTKPQPNGTVCAMDTARSSMLTADSYDTSLWRPRFSG